MQFPVVQFLKLGACQSDGCVLRQQIFFVLHNYQLTMALNYCKLVLLEFFLHKLSLKQKRRVGNPFFGIAARLFLFALFCNAPRYLVVAFQGQVFDSFCKVAKTELLPFS